MTIKVYKAWNKTRIRMIHLIPGITLFSWEDSCELQLHWVFWTVEISIRKRDKEKINGKNVK